MARENGGNGQSPQHEICREQWVQERVAISISSISVDGTLSFLNSPGARVSRDAALPSALRIPQLVVRRRDLQH